MSVMAITCCSYVTLLKYSLLVNILFFVCLFFDTETISRRRTDDFKSGLRSREVDGIRSLWSANGGDPSETAFCRKTILLFGMKQHWKEFCRYEEMSHFKNLTNFPRELTCPAVNCSVTLKYSEQAKDIAGASIVVFTNVYEWLTPEMWTWAHGNRSEYQPWVLVSLDSPLYVPGLIPPDRFRDTTYDWVASYKQDSEVHLPYGYYQPYGQDKPAEVDLKALVANKTRLMAWMSSNCQTLQWDRHRLVNDLKSIIQVDKYGKCGETDVPWNDKAAIQSILGSYKFYLSLENSCCDDYISEKFWRALDLGLVPIVVGASLEQYTKVAPPNSFVHVSQFQSVVELAIHLAVVSFNETKYLEYFQWRKLGTVTVVSQEEQYVTPLKDSTHCSLFKKYIEFNVSEERRLPYMSERWGGSCKHCGNLQWIQDYMKKEAPVYSRQSRL